MEPLLFPHEYFTRSNTNSSERRILSHEGTPLLSHIENDINRSRTRLLIVLMLLLLVSGVVIGTYLMITMNRSENVLPPVEKLIYSKNPQAESESVDPSTSKAPLNTSFVTPMETNTMQMSDQLSTAHENYPDDQNEPLS
ncbi:uncharacterized protein [Battus philenor]|uniref:uncharacterized protein n=1 Tax=Battus philenor TaxID=42288 RepID=UPI0035CF1A3A